MFQYRKYSTHTPYMNAETGVSLAFGEQKNHMICLKSAIPVIMLRLILMPNS